LELARHLASLNNSVRTIAVNGHGTAEAELPRTCFKAIKSIVAVRQAFSQVEVSMLKLLCCTMRNNQTLVESQSCSTHQIPNRSMDAFASAAREWHSLLRDVGDAFVAKHLDAAVQLAVGLICQREPEAAAVDVPADRRDFLTLSSILQRLLETAAREHMTSLLPSATEDSAALQSIPEAFRLRFQQLLEMHWTALTETKSFSLPRVEQFDWRVAEAAVGAKRVELRLQTTDGRSRTLLVPMRQFHELRHSVASVLQEMNQVETHPMMRLAYMEQSSREKSAAP
jgi:hypothetical protein